MMSDDAEVQAIFSRAADLCAQGWCQLRSAKDMFGNKVAVNHPNAIRWCLTGAIQRALLERGLDCMYDLNDLPDALKEAIRRIVKAVVASRGIAPKDFGGGPTWNNALKRTQAEVVAFLRDCAEFAAGGSGRDD